MRRKPLGVTLVVCLVLSGLANLRPALAGTGPARSAQAPAGDYGDAPDGSLAGYAEPFAKVIGRFPTQFNTANSRRSLPGGHTLRTGQETLGVGVSREVDATDPADPDGTINLVNEDGFDDGISIGLERRSGEPIRPAAIEVIVTVADTAPDLTRYVNILIDLNRDGVWQRFGDTEEWVVENLEVTVPPGSSAEVVEVPLVSPGWIRIALTRELIPDSADGWDGSGQFEFGEIEDYYLPVIGGVAAAFQSAAIASAFVDVGAGADAEARASCGALVASLSTALATAQANAQAIATACAQAQAQASAAAQAEARARASAAALAIALANAQAAAAAFLQVVILVPCATAGANLETVAAAMTGCVAAALAQAEAQAAAATAARARAEAAAAACAGALAEAQAATTAMAASLTLAQARAQAMANAVAEAQAHAEAAAAAMPVGGRAAEASVFAEALAAARAAAAAQAACQAITAAFAAAQASFQASARFLAIAQASFEAASAAAAVALAAAEAAFRAEATAGLIAGAFTAAQASITTILNRECLDDLCEGITAITLLSFTATARAAKVQLVWETGTEVNNAGFHLYRATAPDGPYTKITGALIAARGDAVSGARYSFVDEPGAGTFYYKLDDVTLNGRHTFHGPVRVSVRP